MKKILQVILLFIITINLCGCNSQEEYDYEANLFNDGLAVASKYVKGTSSFSEKLKYGYFNDKGEVVIDFIYDDANPFINGLAIVKLEEDYYLINTKGEKISQSYSYLYYDAAHEIYSGSDESDPNHRTNILSKDGVVLGKFRSFYGFDEGIGNVRTADGDYAMIDVNCNILATFLYSYSFYGDYAMVLDENHDQWIIDRNMNYVHNFENQSIDLFNGYVVVDDKKIYNVNGEYIKDINPYCNANIFAKYYYGDEFGSGINYFGIYNDNVVYNVEDVASIKGYKILYSRGSKELYLYDDKLNLIQTVKLDSYYLIYPDYDRYRNDIYLRFRSNDNDTNIYYMFDYSELKIKRVKFLDQYDTIVNVFENHISVKKDDLYGLVKLDGKVIFDAKSKKSYVSTSDGYIFDSYNKILYDYKKNKKLDLKEWHSIVVPILW